MHSGDRIAGCDQSAVNMYKVSVLVPVMTVIGTVLLAYRGSSSGGSVDLGGGLEAVPSHFGRGVGQEVTAEAGAPRTTASGVDAVVQQGQKIFLGVVKRSMKRRRVIRRVPWRY